MTSPFKAVLFDLDGCLVDTAPDMAAALNAVRLTEGLPALDYDLIRPVVSHGGAGLVKLAFDLNPDDTDFERLRQQFLDVYEANLADQSSLFDGFEDVLQSIEQAGLTWGIITNKPAWLTNPLVAELGLNHRAACVVSGDTTAHSKPHPAPMLHACDLINIQPEHCLYMGDADRDIEAGNAVGMTTAAVTWGYLADNDDVTTWQADHILHHPREIMDLLGG